LMAFLFDTIWQAYNNGEDSNWLPFLVPLAFWTSFLLYAKRKSIKYARWAPIHLIHHVGAMSQASLSLYFDDDSIFNERITILWSLSYFVVDVVDCLIEMHLTYSIHGVVCMLLGLYNYITPLHRELRMNSKAAYIEASSLLLDTAKRTRNPQIFIAFAILYTCCRIIWIPFIMKEMLDNNVEWTRPTMLLLCIFYALNWWWYLKILKILYKSWKGEPTDDKPSSESKKDK
jgi:hypothetical protein